jgi:hypothetical protein
MVNLLGTDEDPRILARFAAGVETKAREGGMLDHDAHADWSPHRRSDDLRRTGFRPVSSRRAPPFLAGD